MFSSFIVRFSYYLDILLCVITSVFNLFKIIEYFAHFIKFIV